MGIGGWQVVAGNLTKGRDTALTQKKMSKMMIEAGMCMKTQEKATRCPTNIRACCQKLQQFRKNERNFLGFLAENTRIKR
jgi:hypothetical protein